MKEFIASNISEHGDHLIFAGQDTCNLAKQFGTPLYLLDEDRIRENCSRYINAFQTCFGDNALPLYASKANSFVGIYRLMKEMKMGIDVVSCGEIYTAKNAGFDLSQAYFHGNCKTDEDIAYAMEAGIGTFVCDSLEELKAINKEAERRGCIQRVMLRLSPGIDPHTYEEVSTGKVDSKFGIAIETGQADEALQMLLTLTNLKPVGFHCHIGSQVFTEDVYERALQVMLDFIASVKQKYGFQTEELNMGGGFGIPYVSSDGSCDIGEKLRILAEILHTQCKRLHLAVPRFLMEPGRSIVADAGMTLYSVGSVKRIKGYKNYVAVDGGMADNPRFALYKSRYTVLTANKMNEAAVLKADLVGRCCESGDILQPDSGFPESIERGDTVAVCTTGAYNYSMASNYNRLPRPAMVLLKEGKARLAVRRETFEDLVKNEL